MNGTDKRNSYKDDLLYFLKKNYSYMLPLAICAAACFAFISVNQTICVDTLNVNDYFQGECTMLYSGRIGMVLLSNLFTVFGEVPGATNIFAVCFLCFAAVNFCILFKRASCGKLPTICYTIFSCLFVSYPLISEIWQYKGMPVNIGVCYLTTALALLAMQRFLRDKTKKSMPVYACLCMFISVTTYESYACLYVTAVLALIIADFIFNDEKEYKFSNVFKIGLIYALALIGGLALRFAVDGILHIVFNLPKGGGGDTEIVWFTQPFGVTIKNMVRSFGASYVVNALWYYPITILLFSEILSVVLAIYGSVKKKNRLIFLFYFFMGVSLYLLTLIAGRTQGYRTSQSFAFYIGFIFMIALYYLYSEKKTGRWSTIAVSVILSLLCIFQCLELNRWFFLDYRRSEEEANVVRTVGYELCRDYDVSKPVVFVGAYTLSEEIIKEVMVPADSGSYKFAKSLVEFEPYRFVETNVNSVITWSVNVPNSESILSLFDYYGYSFKDYDRNALYGEAYAYAVNNMKPYPQNGYIHDNGEYIIVMFGY